MCGIARVYCQKPADATLWPTAGHDQRFEAIHSTAQHLQVSEYLHFEYLLKWRAKSKADAAQLQILANEIIKIRSGFSAHSQGTTTATSSSSYVPTTEATSSTYETDESITDETDEDDLSRMSTTEANEQRISVSMEESMEEEQHTEEESN